ncbi:MAG: glycosyltransferase family protein [Deltaproteobacteria bacterium]|nr:glycosyltransferase family protein [Deltaproteobacteria bacterium]
MASVKAIIQARMGSTRLPQKVLMPLLGKPMLLRITQRLERCHRLDGIIVATTDLPEDDVVAQLVERQPSLQLTRGSSRDVLGRYAQAAQEHSVDVVVRVTGDCPLIDPETVDRCISEFARYEDECDYVSNTLKRTFPRGLDTEVFPKPILLMAEQNARGGSEREHVTPYIWKEPLRFRIRQVKSATDWSHLRWTVDTMADFELVARVYEELGSDGAFDYPTICALFSRTPELMEINRHIDQKPFESKGC